MIKINLLESVTDRPQGVAAVEDKVASPRMQTLLLALTVFGLMVLAMGYDYVSSNMAAPRRRKSSKIKSASTSRCLRFRKSRWSSRRRRKRVQARIDAIKKLRESQQGPSAVLQEIKARFDAVPGLYLKASRTKTAKITIKGESPNEYSVTKFGQSLEFSNGLFSNLNIETQRGSEKQAGKTPRLRRRRRRISTVFQSLKLWSSQSRQTLTWKEGFTSQRRPQRIRLR